MRSLVIGVLAASLIGCTCFGPQQMQQASLTGCTEADGFACSDGATGTRPIDSTPLVLRDHRVAKAKKAITAKKENHRPRRKATTHTKNAKSDIVSKKDASLSVQPDNKSNAMSGSSALPKKDASLSVQSDNKSNAINGSSVLRKKDASPSVQPDIKSDAINEAKIAAKAENPQSSHLDDKVAIKRAKAAIALKMGENPTSIQFIKMKRAVRKDTLDNSIDTICGKVRGENTGDRPFLYLVQEDRAFIGGYIIATSPYRNICN